MSAGCRLGQLFHQYVQQTRAQNSFSSIISKRLQFLSSAENLKRGCFQFPLHQSDCHAFAVAQEGQTVHGGVIATVVEDATTMHICANDTRSRKAVTTDMNLTYAMASMCYNESNTGCIVERGWRWEGRPHPAD
eukprot:g20635.t1